MDRITYQPETWALATMGLIGVGIVLIGAALWKLRYSPDRIALIEGGLAIIAIGVFHFLF